MIELIKNPVTISVGLIIFGVFIKLWFDARADKDTDQANNNGKKKSKGYGKKAKDFGENHNEAVAAQSSAEEFEGRRLEV